MLNVAADFETQVALIYLSDQFIFVFDYLVLSCLKFLWMGGVYLRCTIISRSGKEKWDSGLRLMGMGWCEGVLARLSLSCKCALSTVRSHWSVGALRWPQLLPVSTQSHNSHLDTHVVVKSWWALGSGSLMLSWQIWSLQFTPSPFDRCTLLQMSITAWLQIL